jgi:hypothetical protein
MSLSTTEIQALIARYELQAEAAWTDKPAKLLAEKTLDGLRELLSLRIEAQRLKERKGGRVRGQA